MADREEIHFIGDDQPAPVWRMAETDRTPVAAGRGRRAAPSSPRGRKGVTIRKFVIMAVVVSFLFGVVRPAYLIFDARHHGPFAVAYNRGCQRLAEDARLIGKPDTEVIRILGEPTAILEPDTAGGWTKTFTYAPVSFVSAAKFQVHCRDGFVASLEQLDD